VRSAVLRGRDHQVLGEIAAVGEGPAGVAMCMGGAAKTYHHSDPNEDVALFAVGEVGWLTAVADGHRGFEASEIAIDHMLANPAPQWTDGGVFDMQRWERHVLAVLADANDEILREVLNSEKSGARTTLAIALVAPKEGRLYYAAIGDSHIFRVADRHAEDLAIRENADDGAYFLGHGDETADSLREKCEIGSVSLANTRAVVLATDGLSERHIGVASPELAVLESVDRAQLEDPGVRPIVTCRRLIHEAIDAQISNRAGDNICAATLWISGVEA
jgi:serine/threonine protein phosphatase PrpC